jgi:titin
VIRGNFIGTDKTGTVGLGNVRDAILIGNGATGNIIGGAVPGAANLISGGSSVVPITPLPPAAVFSLDAPSISGNIARFGVEVHYIDVATRETVYVGVDLRNSSSALAPVDAGTGQQDFSAFGFTPSSALGTGWAPIANAFPGEFLFQTPPPPGTQPANGLAPNATYLVGTISYDLAKFGITPSDSLLVSLMGKDTVIGTEVTGVPATFTFVTPTFSPGEQPLQSGQNRSGVEITGAGTNGNIVQGNLIGTDVSGEMQLGHLSEGVFIHDGAANNLVGGSSFAAGNVIAGNDVGVAISGTGSTQTVVSANHIGSDVHDAQNLGNVVAGVLIDSGAVGSTIGGLTPGAGNTVAFNGKGVIVGSDPTDIGTVGHSILGNKVMDNVGLGIALGNEGPTTNGPNPRPFPNHGQNSPVVDSLTLSSVSGHLTSAPNVDYHLEFFATPVTETSGQGGALLGTETVRTDASGTVSFSAPVSTVPLGTVITATATNLTTGDTSAFSPVGVQLLVFSNPVIVSSDQPQTVTLMAQIFNGYNPVETGQVTFRIPGITGDVTATPNGQGIFTANVIIPPETPPGEYPITATFVGGEGNPTVGVGTLVVLPSTQTRIGRRWNR